MSILRIWYCFIVAAVACSAFISWRLLLSQHFWRIKLTYIDTEVKHPEEKLLYLAKDDFKLLKDAYPAVWVEEPGPVSERIKAMNEYLNKYRNLLLSKPSHFNNTWSPVKGPWNVISGLNVDFHREVANSGDVIPIFLPWIVQPGGTKERPLNSLTDNTNLLVQKYYQWTGESELCEWINSGTTQQRYHIVHESKCLSDKTLHKKATSLLLITLNSKPAYKNLFPTYPPQYYTEHPKLMMYVLIATNAVFTNIGDLFTRTTKYIPYTCSQLFDIKYGSFENAMLYDEVFSISQYWGSAFYHINVEDLPRLAPFLPWLRANPDIKVHVFETYGFTAEILEILGISQKRLVSGDVRAKIAYLPESSGCGFNLVTQSQFLSAEYQDIIKNRYKQRKRNSVVLIRRSGGRKLTQHKETEAALRKAAVKHKLNFELFIDNPSPPLEEAMKMFNRAVMVVAPHGAGLSNLMFAQPATFVIEAVCNRPIVNLCYQRLAYSLGHHYHAVPSKYGCEGSINIDIESMVNSIETFVPMAAKLRVD